MHPSRRPGAVSAAPLQPVPTQPSRDRDSKEGRDMELEEKWRQEWERWEKKREEIRKWQAGHPIKTTADQEQWNMYEHGLAVRKAELSQEYEDYWTAVERCRAAAATPAPAPASARAPTPAPAPAKARATREKSPPSRGTTTSTPSGDKGWGEMDLGSRRRRDSLLVEEDGKMRSRSENSIAVFERSKEPIRKDARLPEEGEYGRWTKETNVISQKVTDNLTPTLLKQLREYGKRAGLA